MLNNSDLNSGNRSIMSLLVVDQGQQSAEQLEQSQICSTKFNRLKLLRAILGSTFMCAILSPVGVALSQTSPLLSEPVQSPTAGLVEYNLLGQALTTQINQLDRTVKANKMTAGDAKSLPEDSVGSKTDVVEEQPTTTVGNFEFNLIGKTAAHRISQLGANAQMTAPIAGKATVGVEETLPSQETPPPPSSEVLAQVTPLAAANPKDLDVFVSQSPTASSEQIQQRLTVYQQKTNFGNIFKGSPGITIANPAGYGADDNTVFASATLQSRTRFTSQADGALGFGVGLLNSVETVGLELSYTVASFGNSRPFGAGGFNLKVHRSFPGDFAVAVGWNGVITIDDPFGDFKDSVYGVVTKVFRVNDSLEDPFSRIAVSFGAGSGQFRSVADITNRRNTVNVFASTAVRVIDQASAIVEWTGQDLALGVSIVPIKDFYWTITPAVRDITGAGDGARFVLGTSVGIQF